MPRSHLQLHLKTCLEQMLREQADGQKHCARASRIPDLPTCKIRRETVRKRDVLTYKRRVLVYTPRETVKKSHELVNTHLVLVDTRYELINKPLM